MKQWYIEIVQELEDITREFLSYDFTGTAFYDWDGKAVIIKELVDSEEIDFGNYMYHDHEDIRSKRIHEIAERLLEALYELNSPSSEYMHAIQNYTVHSLRGVPEPRQVSLNDLHRIVQRLKQVSIEAEKYDVQAELPHNQSVAYEVRSEFGHNEDMEVICKGISNFLEDLREDIGKMLLLNRCY